MGEALTVKVTVWPSSSVAVTWHWSAEAAGIAAMPMVAKASPTVVMAIFSFLLLDTLPLTPPAAILAAPNVQGRRAMDANEV